MVMIRLDPVRVQTDASDVGEITKSLISSWNALHSGLSGTAGMAGDDEGAEQWGLAYDEFAPKVNDVIKSMTGALLSFETLLAFTARTYNNVELFGAGRGDDVSAIDLPPASTATFGEIPRCIGVGADGFLGDMQEVLEGALYGLGVTFPRGDTNKLRAASTEWLTFTQDITAARVRLSGALTGIAGTDLPHKRTINIAAHDLDTMLMDVSKCTIGMAEQLNVISQAIDSTWNELNTMALQLAIEIAVEIGISVALSFVTFGGAGVAGAALVTVRIGHWAVNAAGVIRKLASLLRIAGSKVDNFYAILNKFQHGGFLWKAGFQAGSASISSITASFGADTIMGNNISGEEALAYIFGGLAGGVAGGAGGTALRMINRLPNNVVIAMAGGAVEGMAEGVASGLVQATMLNQKFNLGQTLLTSGLGGAAMGGVGHGMEGMTSKGGAAAGGGSSAAVGDGVNVDISVPDTNVSLDIDAGGLGSGTPEMGSPDVGGSGGSGSGAPQVDGVGPSHLDGAGSVGDVHVSPTGHMAPDAAGAGAGSGFGSVSTEAGSGGPSVTGATTSGVASSSPMSDIGNIDLDPVTTTTHLDGLPSHTDVDASVAPEAPIHGGDGLAPSEAASSGMEGAVLDPIHSPESQLIVDSDVTFGPEAGIAIGEDAGAAGVEPSASDTSLAGSHNPETVLHPRYDSHIVTDPDYVRGMRVSGADQFKYLFETDSTGTILLDVDDQPIWKSEVRLGRDSMPLFMSPEVDMINIDNSLEAVIQSGLAESASSAHQNGWELFALSAPLDGVPMRLPTSADAGGWPHYFPGGHTAIRVDDEWVINPTREFVIDGGIPMPPGTMVFRMIEGMGWELFATFK